MPEITPVLSLCAPAYNEAEGIAEVITAWEETLAAFGVTDRDRHHQRRLDRRHRRHPGGLQQRYANLVVVDQQPNAGYGRAVAAAIAHSRGQPSADARLRRPVRSRRVPAPAAEAERRATTLSPAIGCARTTAWRACWPTARSTCSCASCLACPCATPTARSSCCAATCARSIPIEARGFPTPTEMLVKARALGYTHRRGRHHALPAPGRRVQAEGHAHRLALLALPALSEAQGHALPAARDDYHVRPTDGRHMSYARHWSPAAPASSAATWCAPCWSAGCACTVLDDLSMGRRENVPADAAFVEGNVLDAALVERALAGVDVVFHLAARVTIRGSMDHFVDDAQTNVMGTLSVLQACTRRQVRQVRCLPRRWPSTAMRPRPCRSPRPTPRSQSRPTASASWPARSTARLVCAAAGIRQISLRFFNTYGPGQSLTPYVGVMTIFINRCWPASRRSSSATASSAAISSTSATSCRLPAGHGVRGDGQVFNVGSGRGVTVNSLG